MSVDSLYTIRRAASVRPQLLRGTPLARMLNSELPAQAGRWRAPLTARPAWLMATVTARHDQQPWAVALRGPVDRLRGLVLLVDEADPSGRLRTTLLGTDCAYEGAMLADDEAAAYDLGHHLEVALLARPRLGTVHLGPLPANDPRVKAFAAGAGILDIVATDPLPMVQQDGLEAASYLSDGMRRTLRKAHNRLRTDGLTATTDLVTDRATIRAWLPELARHHQARDHAQGRDSAVDNHVGATLWRLRLEALLDEGLELDRLSIDGRLAAYVLGVPDGTAYRLIDGRFIGPWARYAPGRLLETTVLQRVLENPDLDRLDWMTAVAPETLLAQTGTAPMVAMQLKRVD